MSDTNWLKDHLTQIETKIDKLDGRLDNVDVTLAKQNVEIEHHIKRTDIAEENIEKLRQDIKPIQRHIDTLHDVFKIIGVISSVLSMIYGFVKLFDLFK